MKIHSWGTRIWGLSVLAFFALIFGGDAAASIRGSGDSGPFWISTTILIMLAALAVRALRLGLVVTPDEVILRGWLRTRRVQRAQITRVDVFGYSGLYTRGGTSPWFKMLVVTIGGHQVDVQAVAGRPNPIYRLADQLRDCLGLPQPTFERRRHSSPQLPQDAKGATTSHKGTMSPKEKTPAQQRNPDSRGPRGRTP